MVQITGWIAWANGDPCPICGEAFEKEDPQHLFDEHPEELAVALGFVMPEIHWRQKNFWGNAFYLYGWGMHHPFYTFTLFRDALFQPIPRVGDEIMWPEEDGMSHLIVVDVEWKKDPHDMYFVKAWSMGKMMWDLLEAQVIA